MGKDIKSWAAPNGTTAIDSGRRIPSIRMADCPFHSFFQSNNLLYILRFIIIGYTKFNFANIQKIHQIEV